MPLSMILEGPVPMPVCGMSRWQARPVLPRWSSWGKTVKRRLYEHMDHGLFVAFAPFDKPEIAVAVVVEHGGGGGAVAAPIAGRFCVAILICRNPRKS
jgi:cell division protein FtsI/penicillin-binding protein 2